MANILDKFESVKQTGDNQWLALCPVHGDTKPSLSIAFGDDDKLLLHCHAGCRYEDICQAAGIEINNGSSKRTKVPLETYDYKNQFGRLLFQVCRGPRKKFYQRKPDGNGGWSYRLNGVQRVPYNLEKLTRSGSENVYISEGEKDCDRLNRLGFIATTSPGGAGKWRSSYNRYLTGKKIVILPDNDEPGREHAQKVANNILPIAKEVRIVFLDNLPAGGDVSDWLDSGGTKDELMLRVNESKPLRKPGERIKSSPIIVNLADVQPQEVKWLWPNRFAIGKLNLLVGNPELGKSFLTHYIAARISNGRPWPDGSGPAPVGDVILLSAEDGISDTIVPRLIKHEAKRNRIITIPAVKKDDDDREFTVNLARDLPAIEEAIGKTQDCKLVVIDPISAFMGRTDSHKNTEVRGFLAPLAAFAEKHNVCVIGLSHLRKGQGKAINRIMGSMAFVAAARVVWAVTQDKDIPARRLMTKVKNNLAHSAEGLAFRLIDGQVCFDDEAIQMTADEAMAEQDEDEKSAFDEAMDWLQQTLKNGRVKAPELFVAAEKDHISEKTLRRAASKMNIEKKREGFGAFGVWYWQLKEDS